MKSTEQPLLFQKERDTNSKDLTLGEPDGECEKVLLEISGIFENDLFLVTPNDDVVEGAGKLYAGLARHGKKISNRPENVNVSSFHA